MVNVYFGQFEEAKLSQLYSEYMESNTTFQEHAVKL